MRLWDKLHLSQVELPCVIAIVGSGGKTSLMGQLAKEGKEHNLRVAVLTTTHIRKPPEYQEAFSCGEEGRGSITIYGAECKEDKLAYPGDDSYEEIYEQADLILVEADGSRGLPIKYPAAHEPVIPKHTSVILCVAGMSGLGGRGEKVCHRWELAQEKVTTEGNLITEQVMADLLETGYGKPLQQAYPKAAFYYCLNQADTRKLQASATEILCKTGRKGIILSLLDEKNILYAKRPTAKAAETTKIAMIYMASGFGRRYGANKLLEEVEGKPLYLHGLQTLLQAAEILQAQTVVVSQYEEILQKARENGIQAVYNPDSQKGITASIHYGIKAVPDADAYLFSVADQPWMKAESICQLVNMFCSGEKTIGCLSDGKRNGNPVIFSRKYKEELLGLAGDKGGSVIVKKYPEEVIRKIVEEEELRDIDER